MQPPTGAYDLTAFPSGRGDAWSAEDALLRYLCAGLPAERITVSSDGGGCLPVFDADGRVTDMDVGSPGALAAALRGLLDRGQPLERVLPAFTSNPADLLRLPDKGGSRLAGRGPVVLNPTETDRRDGTGTLAHGGRTGGGARTSRTP
jgi:beta-aspartyl-dipeptidase (metallo-type)